MKALLLASTLATVPVVPVEYPELLVTQETQEKVHHLVQPESQISSTSANLLVLLGGTLLGTAAVQFTHSKYIKSVPPEKRISARIFQSLREGQES